MKESTVTHAEGDAPASSWAWDGGWPQSRDEFQNLVETYVDRLVRYAYGRVGSLPDAEDVVQEVFVRAFYNPPKERRSFRIGAYLYRSVANACTDLQRKRKRTAARRERVGIRDRLAGGKDPSEVALATEELRRAEELLSRLPQAQAEVIRLRVFDELRLQEIAEVLGCSVNTVGSRLRYGFRKLRQMVSDKQG